MDVRIVSWLSDVRWNRTSRPCSKPIEQDHAETMMTTPSNFNRMSLSTSSSSSSSSSSASAKRVNLLGGRRRGTRALTRMRQRAPRRRPGRAARRSRAVVVLFIVPPVAVLRVRTRLALSAGGERQPAWRGSWRVAHSGTRSLRQRLAAQQCLLRLSRALGCVWGSARGGKGAARECLGLESLSYFKIPALVLSRELCRGVAKDCMATPRRRRATPRERRG